MTSQIVDLWILISIIVADLDQVTDLRTQWNLYVLYNNYAKLNSKVCFFFLIFLREMLLNYVMKRGWWHSLSIVHDWDFSSKEFFAVCFVLLKGFYIIELC